MEFQQNVEEFLRRIRPFGSRQGTQDPGAAAVDGISEALHSREHEINTIARNLMPLAHCPAGDDYTHAAAVAAQDSGLYICLATEVLSWVNIHILTEKQTTESPKARLVELLFTLQVLNSLSDIYSIKVADGSHWTFQLDMAMGRVSTRLDTCAEQVFTTLLRTHMDEVRYGRLAVVSNQHAPWTAIVLAFLHDATQFLNEGEFRAATLEGLITTTLHCIARYFTQGEIKISSAGAQNLMTDIRAIAHSHFGSGFDCEILSRLEKVLQLLAGTANSSNRKSSSASVTTSPAQVAVVEYSEWHRLLVRSKGRRRSSIVPFSDT